MSPTPPGTSLSRVLSLGCARNFGRTRGDSGGGRFLIRRRERPVVGLTIGTDRETKPTAGVSTRVPDYGHRDPGWLA